MRTKSIETKCLGKSIEIRFTYEFKTQLLNELKKLETNRKIHRVILFFIYMLEKNNLLEYLFTNRILTSLIEEIHSFSINLESILLKFTNAIMFHVYQ